MAAAPRFDELDEDAERWVRGMVEQTRTFLESAGRLDSGEVTPELLDELWVDLRDSLRAADADEASVSNAISGVGVSFGQLLVDRLGMEWVIATDGQGADLAVRGAGCWLIYPLNVVAKRYASDEVGFLRALYETVASRPPRRR
jgi:hypothetical protein